MALRTIIVNRKLGLGFKRNLVGFNNQARRELQTCSLPDLGYDYGDLEPAISGEIMKIHHTKHHQTYVTNYNKALEQLDHAVTKGDASTVVKLQSAIKFNGGGHVNHSIFWKNLSPVSEGGGEPPHGSLGWAIDTHFGSFETLVQKMNSEGAALQGSGWVWLGLDKDAKKLVVETTANQDPLVTKGASLVPLLGIDVWEHAYYLQFCGDHSESAMGYYLSDHGTILLKDMVVTGRPGFVLFKNLQYKNVRPDYLKNIWKVINWKYSNEVYEKECP
ncbi:hypothetical protein IFM89_033503 [Coptis chinensis]|uniref:superoxide dismutase n=1 Tax=Coptis chinensis TaxID=261450 RepID=A0A835LGD0_9MAGN|nr:hypothetical protein IFM89_033503 [Coptis chinensis]